MLFWEDKDRVRGQEIATLLRRVAVEEMEFQEVLKRLMNFVWLLTEFC